MKGLQEEWGNNFSLDTDRKKVKWHDIKVLRVEKEHPNAFFYKTSYEDAEFRKVIVKKTRSQDLKSVQLVPAYSKRFPLTDVKKTALQSLCEKDTIKKPYYDLFYENVFELR